MKNNLISIIIPVFNEEKNISRAIDSALAQTNANFEIIVVNDNSTDNTEKVLQPYIQSQKIKYIKLEKNSGGASLPRNIGVDNAQGEFIAFLDADDYWEKEKLEKQIPLFNDEKIGLVFSDGKFIGENMKKSGKLFSHFLNFHQGNVFHRLIMSNFIPTSSVIIRKSILNETGNFIVDEKLTISEDYDLWLRIAQKYKINHSPNPLFYYQTNTSGLSAVKSQGYKCMLYMYKNWLKKDMNLYEKSLLVLAYSKTLIKIIINNFKQKNTLS